ncbi:MAG: hypothetical protein IKI84_05235 [Clostridia bacterium]|nr:hypothetical protein [Clostridia bacterium]
MKKGIGILLAVCLLASLFTGVLAEGHFDGKPWVNPELPGNLPKERPALEDDFYLNVNYDLHSQPARPPMEGQESDSIGYRLEKEISDDIWGMVDAGAITETKALKIITSLIMDTERREKDGLEPLMEYVRQVKAVKTLEELSALCRREGFLFGMPYATFQFIRSVTDPARFALQIIEVDIVPRLQFDAEDEQPAKEEDWLDKKRLEEELLLLGWDTEGAKQMTERLVKYQLDSKNYFSGEYGKEENGQEADPAPEQLLKTCVPLADELESLGIRPSEGTLLEIISPEIFHFMQLQYKEENLEMFKAMVCLSMYRYAMDYLDPATYAKANDAEDVSFQDVAFRYMRIHARFLTEQAYAEAYISPEQRAQIRELTEECKRALADRMRRCEWLSEKSRENAVKKAETMKVVIVTPEERTDYAPLLEALSKDGISLLEAAIQYDQFERKMLYALAGKPYDRGHRFLNDNPMTDANAVYEPSNNTFYMMAGALKPEFCNTSSRETLLATLGHTIAHEMSHGYENNGVEHDWEGNRNCMLTEEDHVKFNEKAERMSQDMSRIELADGLMLDGSRTFFEQAADLMGLRLVLDLAEKTEGFDYDLFFRTLAGKFYRSFPTREAALSNYSSDFHPAHFVRANFCLEQVDEFYRTYPAVHEGSGMYRAPEDRICLW